MPWGPEARAFTWSAPAKFGIECHNGVTWKVRLRRNGRLVVKTTATTKAPSGSFQVNRRLTNGTGSDRIKASATSPSGQVGTASLTI